MSFVLKYALLDRLVRVFTGGTFCSTGEPAFDLSGMAMTNMALPGRDQELRNLGLYEIQYRRVPCYYPNQNVAFKVDPGSTPFWLSFTIEYQGGPGDIESVAIRQVMNLAFSFTVSRLKLGVLHEVSVIELHVSPKIRSRNFALRDALLLTSTQIILCPQLSFKLFGCLSPGW